MHRCFASLVIAGALLAPAAVSAQAPTEKPVAEPAKDRVLEIGRWYNNVEAGLNLTQASYSENWKGGESGSISWASYLNGDFENQMKPTLNWLNTMRLAYGQTRRQEVDVNGERVWQSSEKSADRVDLESFLRFTRGWAVDPYVSVRLETFFQDVTDPFGRELWFNPMTFKESAGIARKFIDAENHQLTSRVGGAARETYRQFFTAATGDGTRSETAWDAGAEWVTDYKRVFTRVTYTSRLSVYQPFTWSKKEDFEGLSADSLAVYSISPDIAEFSTTADVDWQNTLSTQVSKFISFNFYLEWLYDKYDNTVTPVVENGQLANGNAVAASVRRKGQFKQMFGIGLTYRF